MKLEATFSEAKSLKVIAMGSITFRVFAKQKHTVHFPHEPTLFTNIVYEVYFASWHYFSKLIIIWSTPAP